MYVSKVHLLKNAWEHCKGVGNKNSRTTVYTIRVNNSQLCAFGCLACW